MEDFDVIKRHTKEEVLAMAPREFMGQAITPEAWAKPFDYAKLFEPKSAASLRRALGRVEPVGSSDPPSRGGNGDEEEDNTSKQENGSAPNVHDLINQK